MARRAEAHGWRRGANGEEAWEQLEGPWTRNLTANPACVHQTPSQAKSAGSACNRIYVRLLHRRVRRDEGGQVSSAQCLVPSA